VDRKIISDLANKLAAAVPGELNDLRDDLEGNFRSLLATGLDKMDLVTREEFEIQTKVLARTREKLEQLEKELQALQRDSEV
jgi:BMFP domain-containing protein YqiC